MAVNLYGVPRALLRHQLEVAGLPGYRANQLYTLLYHGNGAPLGKQCATHIKEHYSFDVPRVAHLQRSADGTRKIMLSNPDVECVHIPNEYAVRKKNIHEHSKHCQQQYQSEEDAGTLCVSSQTGCTLACTFCHTGTMPKDKLRSLKTHEIVGQVVAAKTILGNDNGENRGDKHGKVVSIVAMGQGEPGYTPAWFDAIDILTDEYGLNYGKQRITISTSGVVPFIDKLRKKGVKLAISLHATNDDLRSEIMPINKKWGLAELLEACKRYEPYGKRITYEYTLLQGVNDSLADARALRELLKGMNAFVNLIPFNPWPGAPYKTPSNNVVHAFCDEVGRSLPVNVRWPRGRDILAACGQLASMYGNMSNEAKNAQSVLDKFQIRSDNISDRQQPMLA